MRKRCGRSTHVSELGVTIATDRGIVREENQDRVGLIRFTRSADESNTFVAVALAIFHALAWSLARDAADDAIRDPRALDLAVMAGLAFVFPWIVSQSLTNATRALYARGDLDLLLASPVAPGALFAARALAIAVESMVSVAIFLLPVANMLAIVAGPRWLAIYPSLAICGLIGTALGLLLTLALFRMAGSRRTRVVAQVFATVIGATFALGVQAVNFLPAWLQVWLRATLPTATSVPA